LGRFEEKHETLKYSTSWNVEQQDSYHLKHHIGWDFKADDLIELGI